MGACDARELWVFAYGSLMWDPGFAPAEQRPALLYGYHRDFCVSSVVHRGTRARPGLVLGLAPGGACRGLALRVARGEEAAVTAMLDARELVTNVYAPRRLRLRTPAGDVMARCYVCDIRHPQYAGRQAAQARAQVMTGARGRSGCNVDYLARTIAALERLGIHDERLCEIARHCGLQPQSRASARRR